ncbi:MAG: alpha-galactosidase, partial [Actinomycetota bacterium]|nr:alpha-galactosidase [Actinomycetota bacterium]
MRRGAVIAVLALLLVGVAPASAQTAADDTFARLEANQVVLGNSLVERRWSRDELRTTVLIDRRAGGRTWSRGAREFALRVGAAEIGSEQFAVDSAAVTPLPRGGLRLRMTISGPGLTGVRTAEVYPGVAGFRTQTTLTSPAPLTLNEVVLEEAVVGQVKPTIHAFRSGADWREPEWTGPPVQVGDPHAGDWRDTQPGAAGAPLAGAAQWFDGDAGDRRLFMVMERNDFPSSWVEYDGASARLRLQFARDVISLGPFEEMFHIENPNPEGGRGRTMRPGEPFAFEAAFTGLGAGDADAEWQWSKYLIHHRLQPHYPHAVTFNSNNVDSNRLTAPDDGAKDDMDIAAVREQAAVAKRLGVELFVLDDGWQARSGDWCPDSPQCPEPRAARIGHRFPDPEFRAVNEAIAPMKLGLWMSPQHFHPSSSTWQEHPEWICQPAGTGLLLYNQADPYNGSNEAGLAEWSSAAYGHVEAKIREAIVKWGVRFFKFDFMAWLDCAGSNDLYEHKERFVALLDRVRRDHPDVTLQIDETNDYRLFPYESVTRGPSWFQNGSPDHRQLLHNLWLLNPYVPGYSLGQHVLGGDAWKKASVDTLLAAALPSYITLWTDLRKLPDAVVERAATWFAFHDRFRAELKQMTYPLLDDPLEGGWTALQSWDPEKARGALYAFRQDSDAGTKRIALRNVPPGLRFDLFEGPGGERVDRVTSAELTRGLDVAIGSKGGARVLVIVPAPGETPPPTPE